MMEVLSWQNGDAEVIGRAVETLQSGGLVAFPTDTTYALAAWPNVPAAVERLLAQTSSETIPRLTLALDGPQAPPTAKLAPLAQRLARRCWPGPLTLIGDAPDSLPESVRELAAQGQLGLRVPAHAAILQVLRQLGGSLLLADVLPATAPETQAALQDCAALLIDDGPCHFGQLPTVVRVSGERWELLRAGVITKEQVHLQTATLIVFVCTGNTCRSPLAEALCKKKLAEKLNCTCDELPARGFLISSAGVAAFGGDSAALEAIETARSFGASLDEHCSRPLDRYFAEQADHLICMTQGHLRTLERGWPTLSCRPRLLNAEGRDLDDPIGQDQDVYRSCAEQIWQDLDGLINELMLDA